ncbi:hypothetical protein DFJ74DRAFT_678011 [Hyaloraphidium curvatum]|nr:hypothetical protein DFJ74DRAFT_678011 [Hyaloraphidium curvatum]
MALANITELFVEQDDPRNVHLESRAVADLANDEVLIKIEKFGLTANNVSYIITGKSLRYFDFFPAQDKKYGKMNVWGFGIVVKSKHAVVKEGERLWGYFPFASHLVCTPGTVTSTHIVLSRPDLPKDRLAYLTYTRLSGEDPLRVPAELEDHAMVFSPLWSTGFMLADFLSQKTYLGATSKAVIITSASSKTSYALAFCLRTVDKSARVIGLTSKRNVPFVEGLRLYDEIVTYDDIKEKLTVYDGGAVMVDMAGDSKVTRAVYERYGGEANLKGTVRVGATHYEGPGPDKNFYRPKNSSFFFAPAWAQQRVAELGAAKYAELRGSVWDQTVPRLRDFIDIVKVRSVPDAEQLARKMIRGDIDAKAGYVIELAGGAKL